MEVANDSVVLIRYSVTDEEGELVDSSEGRAPLAYIQGQGQVVPGLESALLGSRAGAHVTVTVAPDQGFGEYDEALDLELPIDIFPEEARLALEPGAKFRGAHPERLDESIEFTIVAHLDDAVVVTGNHPLAGKTLHFDVEVLEVRQATPDELQRGHVHTPGPLH